MQKQPRGCKEFKVMSEEMNDKSGMYNSGSGRDGYKSRDVENNRSGRTGRPRINSAGRVWSDRTPSREATEQAGVSVRTAAKGSAVIARLAMTLRAHVMARLMPAAIVPMLLTIIMAAVLSVRLYPC